MPRVRYTGQVEPRIPASAPLSTRLQAEVYALDGVGEYWRGIGDCYTGPSVGPRGRGHLHQVACGETYVMSPGARLEVSPSGELFETLGETTEEMKTRVRAENVQIQAAAKYRNRLLYGGIAAGGAVALYLLFRKKGKR